MKGKRWCALEFTEAVGPNDYRRVALGYSLYQSSSYVSLRLLTLRRQPLRFLTLMTSRCKPLRLLTLLTSRRSKPFRLPHVCLRCDVSPYVGLRRNASKAENSNRGRKRKRKRKMKTKTLFERNQTAIQTTLSPHIHTHVTT